MNGIMNEDQLIIVKKMKILNHSFTKYILNSITVIQIVTIKFFIHLNINVLITLNLRTLVITKLLI